MLTSQSLQLRVVVDVGTQSHSVAIVLTDGSLLEADDVDQCEERKEILEIAPSALHLSRQGSRQGARDDGHSMVSVCLSRSII